MQDVTLYTNKMCPFAQKAWIALEEKQVEYEMVEIGLYGSGGKPSWFLDMNPKGQVPVLKHGDKVVVESDEIIKYIDQNLGKQLELKARDDAVEDWLSLLRKELQPKGKAVVQGYGSKQDFVSSVLDKVEARIAGPFLTGNDFSLADVAMAPFLLRLFSEPATVGLDQNAHPKLHQYWERVAVRPSVQASTVRSWWWWW